MAQRPHIFSTLAIRTKTDPMSLANAVRATVWSVDEDQPVWKVRSLGTLLEQSVGQRRFILLLLSAYSILALILASVGIYGVLAYSVSQRLHEIGVRMALGADRGSVIRLVVRQGLRLTAIGVSLGILTAVGLARLIEKLLFGVKPSDPWVYIFLSLLLAGVALLACCIPALRASRVDPMAALRIE
jgi:ABC-type antimicrobial peptide transport system permease subunit